MDIEKLIEQLNGYFEGETLTRGAALDAATTLSTLQAENEKLRAELEQVKAERDAAITDLKKWSICATCKNYCPCNKSTHCRVKRAYLPGGNWAGCSNWQWRGPQKED